MRDRPPRSLSNVKGPPGASPCASQFDSEFFGPVNVVVKGEFIIRPAWPDQELVGAALAFDLPTNAFQSGEHPANFSRRPVAH